MRHSLLSCVTATVLCPGWLAIVLLLSDGNPNSAFGQDPALKEEIPTAPISVTGRALKQDDTPVAGAKITLVSTNGIDKLLAETKTDADGRYVFSNAPLPIRKPERNFIATGSFQVFGEADGLAIAWHGMRYYHPQPRPEDRAKFDQDPVFYQDEKIEVGLVFRRAMELKGRVMGDNGRPVANTKIYLSTLDYLDTDGREFHRNYREFWAMHFAPAKCREAMTRTDGQFAITGLPEDTVVNVQVQHPDFADQMFLAAITDSQITENEYIANRASTVKDGQQVSLPIWETRKVVTSPLAIELKSTRRVKVRILHDDDQLPAGNIRVYANSMGDGPRTGSYGTTDDQGQVELKLPPGTYRLMADPPRDSDYVRSAGSLIVKEQPQEQEFDFDLNIGCIVIFEAVDAGDGSGIPGASFMYVFHKGTEHGRSPVNTSAAYPDYPVTNDKGEMRIVAIPGRQEYDIMPPKGYQSHGDWKKTVECKGGTTIRIQYELTTAPAK